MSRRCRRWWFAAGGPRPGCRSGWRSWGRPGAMRPCCGSGTSSSRRPGRGRSAGGVGRKSAALFGPTLRIVEPRCDIGQRVVRRAHRAFLPAGDVRHVLAGEQERAVALQQQRVMLRARLAAPFRPGRAAERNVLPGHRHAVRQMPAIVRMQALAVGQRGLQPLRRRSWRRTCRRDRPTRYRRPPGCPCVCWSPADGYQICVTSREVQEIPP